MQIYASDFATYKVNSQTSTPTWSKAGKSISIRLMLLEIWSLIIEKFVDKSNEATEGVEVADEQQDLRDRILKFGNEHPRVSQFLTQTTDLLAMMGI